MNKDARYSCVEWQSDGSLCQAATRKGSQCTNGPQAGSRFCGIRSHQAQKTKIPPQNARPEEREEEPACDDEQKQDDSPLVVRPWTRSVGSVVLAPTPKDSDGQGWIYAFHIPGNALFKDFVKIGLTERDDVQVRLNEQHKNDYGGLKENTPGLLFQWSVSKCHLAENMIHDELAYWRQSLIYKPNATVHREWFEIPKVNGVDGHKLVKAVVLSKCLEVDIWHGAGAGRGGRRRRGGRGRGSDRRGDRPLSVVENVECVVK